MSLTKVLSFANQIENAVCSIETWRHQELKTWVETNKTSEGFEKYREGAKVRWVGKIVATELGYGVFYLAAKANSLFVKAQSFFLSHSDQLELSQSIEEDQKKAFNLPKVLFAMLLSNIEPSREKVYAIGYEKGIIQ